MSSLPLVSVIIPVRNDAERLQLCLAALAEQTYPRERYEVIVVDNGDDGSLAALRTGTLNAQILRESITGSYAARNRGIEQARGSILAFTDADCLPAADWIEQGVAAIERDGADLVAGEVAVFSSRPRPNAIELYEMILAFDQQGWIAAGRGGATANLFVSRVVIDAVGPFRPEMKSGGDLEMGARVHRRGFRTAYSSTAVVRHPARRTFRDLRERVVRTTRGSFALSSERKRFSAARQSRTLLLHWRRVAADPRLKGPSQRFRAFFVLLIVQIMKNGEILRWRPSRR